MKFLLTFFALSLVNVVFSTFKSIITVKGDKWVASVISATYYGFYNIVLIWTVADFPLWQKCVVTFVTNLLGVFIVKYIEERRQETRLWKVEATIPFPENTNKNTFIDEVKQKFNMFNIQFNYIDIDKYLIVNCYCYDKVQTSNAKFLIKEFNGKGFASEAKISI